MSVWGAPVLEVLRVFQQQLPYCATHKDLPVRYVYPWITTVTQRRIDRIEGVAGPPPPLPVRYVYPWIVTVFQR